MPVSRVHFHHGETGANWLGGGSNLLRATSAGAPGCSARQRGKAFGRAGQIAARPGNIAGALGRSGGEHGAAAVGPGQRSAPRGVRGRLLRERGGAAGSFDPLFR